MQDWITDSHEAFQQTVKTATELYDEEFHSCTTCEQSPWFSFFFDGTGNNRNIDTTPDKLSNVARLYQGHILDEPLIVARYYEGIGTPLDVSNPSWIDRIRDSEMIGGGTGLGGDVRLRKAEREFDAALLNNHRVSRINLAVFGFSRGATLARAFVNKLLKKCERIDGVPHWPCSTAVNGKSAPLHIRFLGLFDTVESVGLPGHDLAGMLMHVPDDVEKCLHLVAGHEIRSAFPLTRLGKTTDTHREFVYPGVHSDVGGGYRPDEQKRSNRLACIPLNRMRLEAAIAGVPFTPPALLDATTSRLFEYDADLKAAFNEYEAAADIGATLEAKMAANMRLYYGWLKARYETNPCDVYKDVCGANSESEQSLERIRSSYSTITAQMDSLNWRLYWMQMEKTDRHAWQERAKNGGVPPKLSAEELEYYEAWLNPPKLSDGLMRFFDDYVHDSRAGFKSFIGKGLYLTAREIIAPSGDQPIKANVPSPKVKTDAISYNQVTPIGSTHVQVAPSVTQ
ncbi:T6SS phospholipase effector Tle1-like catalytic domain-containing protein [Paraburkholderia caribensis]|uniref:T6SS phospholipase effector Tle1-like catalytic domain-containing protein n=1 Tax=Paraburkholderia caribensis TaxID=75105 RepID=UPI0028666148|nr:DUF2235 domain-containing protein [Paraburkholderia caribensis]MDR6384258.1 hypothetical protein [Paraburkholderia caribensis]